jgi:pyrimidine-nucleoside phosphorylase
MYDLIMKKRDGGPLSTGEIEFFVREYTRGRIPDAQAAALLMAVYFRGLDPRETADLTLAIASSGQRPAPPGAGPWADKHSTGGVGDKTTLVVVPLVAAAGVPVLKMAGRSLGHTGGTIDKLESIPGFDTGLSLETALRQVREVGAALVGHTPELAPADAKLYSLRDLTATVDSLPLIAASIMGKKLATGARALVLDVKTGRGALMTSPEEAVALARLMVDIGTRAGVATAALVTDMDQPLGRAVGNALEVREAITTLHGAGPPDLTELALRLGGHLLFLAGAVPDPEAGYQNLSHLLREGAGLAKLRQIVAAQGGDLRVVDEPDRLPQGAVSQTVCARESGWLAVLDARKAGEAALLLGAGRTVPGVPVDPGAGIVIHKKVGDPVRAGEALATLYAATQAAAAAGAARLEEGVAIAPVPPPSRPLIHTVVGA